MLLSLRQQITNFAHKLQDELFPTVEAEAGELGEPAQRFIAILAMIPLRRFVPVSKGWNGRPSKDRHAIACAYVAKVVYNFPDTRLAGPIAKRPTITHDLRLETRGENSA